MSNTRGEITGKRKHPRYLFHQMIKVKRQKGIRAGYTRDLSAGGLFVYADTSFESSNLVEFSIELCGERLVTYMAVVRHVRKGEGDAVLGAGLELFGTTQESRLEWIRHLHWIQERGAASAS
jgi:hypothetical protein